ncbi:MAG: hypothetical protein KAQ64_05335 [Candidatus Pacebacteria bacterium]|nr:hypothetical protein [Candidatus Paceibacterota bacterium]
MSFETTICVCGERIDLHPAKIERQERKIFKGEPKEHTSEFGYSIECPQCGTTRITKISLELRNTVDFRYNN